MPRAIWSGSIAFGLVNAPVKTYSAMPSDLLAALRESVEAAKGARRSKNGRKSPRERKTRRARARSRA